MNPHKLILQIFSLLIIVLVSAGISFAKGPAKVRLGIVVDERLAALRRTPQLDGALVHRLSRGRRLFVSGAKTTPDGIVFLRVAVTSRTRGWIQREAVVSPGRAGDDGLLFNLIKASEGFDQIVRARLFLDHFATSPFRPKVLLLLGNAAQAQAAELSRAAVNRLNARTGHAPDFSYFLNYSGLDRYNRQRVIFSFKRSTRRFYYDGAAWRELVRRYPNSPEAVEARRQLAALAQLAR